MQGRGGRLTGTAERRDGDGKLGEKREADGRLERRGERKRRGIADGVGGAGGA